MREKYIFNDEFRLEDEFIYVSSCVNDLEEKVKRLEEKLLVNLL